MKLDVTDAQNKPSFKICKTILTDQTVETVRIEPGPVSVDLDGFLDSPIQWISYRYYIDMNVECVQHLYLIKTLESSKYYNI